MGAGRGGPVTARTAIAEWPPASAWRSACGSWERKHQCGSGTRPPTCWRTPTWYDPCSRVVLEALSVGLPVVTTHFNGAAEVMEADQHGEIVGSPDDVMALSRAIADVLGRAGARYARGGRERVSRAAVHGPTRPGAEIPVCGGPGDGAEPTPGTSAKRTANTRFPAVSEYTTCLADYSSTGSLRSFALEMVRLIPDRGRYCAMTRRQNPWKQLSAALIVAVCRGRRVRGADEDPVTGRGGSPLIPSCSRSPHQCRST